MEQKKRLSLLLSIVFLTLVSLALVSATDITSCGYTISGSDTYYLTGDINYTTGADCITITINDVIIDCQGYAIDFEDGSAVDTWSAISTSPTCYNVVIRNCVIKGRWLFGIFENTGDSDNWLIENNVIDNMTYGIFYISPYFIIQNNKINTTSVYQADDFTIQSQAQHSVVRNNILSSSGETIRLNGGATNNTFYNNYFKTNSSYSIGEWEDEVTNYFNTTEYVDTNIIGGSNIGGNWYSDYSGTDGNSDGFGDTPYLVYNTQLGHYTPAMNDSLPLVYPVSNTAPYITGIAITPNPAYRTDTLNCSATYNDTEGNKGNVSIYWYNGSALYSSTTKLDISNASLVSDALPTGTQAGGETWNCTMNATDSLGLSGNASSTAIEILYPIVVSVDVPTITPANPKVSEDLNCSTTAYISNTSSIYALKVNLTLTKNGNAIQTWTKDTTNGSLTSQLLGSYQIGDNISCQAIAYAIEVALPTANQTQYDTEIDANSGGFRYGETFKTGATQIRISKIKIAFRNYQSGVGNTNLKIYNYTAGVNVTTNDIIASSNSGYQGGGSTTWVVWDYNPAIVVYPNTEYYLGYFYNPAGANIWVKGSDVYANGDAYETDFDIAGTQRIKASEDLAFQVYSTDVFKTNSSTEEASAVIQQADYIINITNCMNITGSGNYQFTGILNYNGVTNPCINITVDDVVIDGQGFEITGSGINYRAFSLMAGDNWRNNITIKNVNLSGYPTVSGWDTGFLINKASNCSFINNTVRATMGIGDANLGNGAILQSSLIEGNRFYSSTANNPTGIWLQNESSNNNIIKDNYFNISGASTGNCVYSSTLSGNNSYLNNVMFCRTEALYFDSCRYNGNKVIGNEMTCASETHGCLDIEGCQFNIVAGNKISGTNDAIGFQAWIILADNNLFHDNQILSGTNSINLVEVYGGGYQNLTFLNTTGITNIYATTSVTDIINVGWYVKITARNSSDVLGGASVSIYNRTGNLVVSGITQPDGTFSANLTEYTYQNANPIFYHSLYNISITSNGHYDNSTELNVTDNKQVEILMNSLTPPVISDITIAPDPAYKTDTLNCSAIYSDINEEIGNANIYWYNGTDIYSSASKTGIANGSMISDILTAGIQHKGEIWNCTVNATDGVLESLPNSTIITISNTAPIIPEPTIVPAPAYDNSTLNCSTTFNDADADTGAVQIRWLNDTIEYSTTTLSGIADGQMVSFELTTSIQNNGEAWNCTVNATDSEDLASAPASRMIVINDTMPIIDSLDLQPASPYVTDDLNCSFSITHPDPDPITVNITFYDETTSTILYNKETSGVFIGSSILTSGNLTKHHTYICQIAVADTSYRVAENTTARTVLNSAPTGIIEIKTVTNAENPECSFTPYDADNDTIKVNISFAVDGTYFGSSITNASSGEKITMQITPQTAGSNVTCTAFADDYDGGISPAYMNSTIITSAVVDLISPTASATIDKRNVNYELQADTNWNTTCSFLYYSSEGGTWNTIGTNGTVGTNHTLNWEIPCSKANLKFKALCGSEYDENQNVQIQTYGEICCPDNDNGICTFTKSSATGLAIFTLDMVAVPELLVIFAFIIIITVIGYAVARAFHIFGDKVT
jgi:hypothetical protein